MSPAYAPPYFPTNDLVAVAWLSQRVPEFDASMVATTLPKLVTAWADKGFVQARSVAGGLTDVDVPENRKPIVQVDFWAVNLDASGAVSAKPAWGEANHLAECVRAAIETQTHGQPVTLPAAYLGARVQSAYLLGEPYRVESDPSGYARLTADLALDWVRA